MVRLSFPIYYTIERKTGKNKTFLVGFNWARNCHHFTLNKVKHHYHDLVLKSKLEQNIVVNSKRIKVHYKIYTKRTTDGGNIRSIIEKFVLDGLVEHGIIKDDNVTIVIGDSAEYYAVKENFRAEIYIEEIL